MQITLSDFNYSQSTYALQGNISILYKLATVKTFWALALCQSNSPCLIHFYLSFFFSPVLILYDNRTAIGCIGEKKWDDIHGC